MSTKLFVIILWSISKLEAVQDALDQGTFWHVTDFHLDLNYPQHNCAPGLNDYQCDTSTELLQSTMETIDKLNQNNTPDFVVWGGDGGPHTRERNSSLLMETIAVLSRGFRNLTSLQGVPILPVLGNHDVYPTNAMSGETEDTARKAWCSLLGGREYWANWVNQDNSVLTDIDEELPPTNFNEACYYSKLMTNKSRILFLGLNGLLWYQNNPLLNTSIADPINQIDWLERNLKWAQKTNTKVLMVSHFPLGATTWDPRNALHTKPFYNTKILKLFREYHQNIMSFLVSHEHADTYRVILSDECEPVGSMFLAPSVTPFFLYSIGDFNPRIRRYSYSRSKRELLDYTQYWLNLSDTSKGWRVEYTASKEYGLKDLSPSELARLTDDFTKGDDVNGYWSLYWKHLLGGRKRVYAAKFDENSNCPVGRSYCRCEHVCGIRHVDQTEILKCLGNCCSSSPSLPTIADRCGLPQSSTKIIIGATVIVIAIVVVGALACALTYRRRQAS